MKEEVAKVNFYSNILMGITSIHHIYGAFAYNTPWRLHVLAISIPMIIFSLIISRFLTTSQSNLNRLLQWIFWMAIFIFSVVLIGAYEGVYNHALKNLVHFTGVSENLQRQLFPPPKYVMPNNLIFEVSGIMQAVIFVPLIKAFIHLSRKMKISMARAGRN
jgi:hypothetical protein